MPDSFALILDDRGSLPAVRAAFLDELGTPLLDEALDPTLIPTTKSDTLQALQVLLAIPAAALAAASLNDRLHLVEAVGRLLNRLRGLGVSVRLPGQPAQPIEALAVPALLAAAESTSAAAPAWDVYLASAPADLDRVLPLHAALQAQGLRVYWDGTAPLPDQPRSFAASNAQRLSRATVLVCSASPPAATVEAAEHHARGLRILHPHNLLPVYLDGLPAGRTAADGLDLRTTDPAAAAHRIAARLLAIAT